MDRNRKQLTRATVVAAAVITAGLTAVIAANRVARQISTRKLPTMP